MTQPIQEPSTPRKLSAFGYGQEQLFRRPNVDAGAASVEWGRGNAEITTSAIDYVEPDFLNGTNATFERTSNAIFDVNGAGRLVILQGNPGTYVLAVNIFDALGDGGSDTYAKLLLNFVAAIPSGIHMIPGWFDNSSDTDAYEITFPLRLDATSNDFSLVASPWTQIIYLDDSDADLVFRMRGAMVKDGSFEASNSMNIILSAVRIGDATAAVIT